MPGSTDAAPPPMGALTATEYFAKDIRKHHEAKLYSLRNRGFMQAASAGYSYAEIGRWIGMTKSGVKKGVYKARIEKASS